MNFSHRINIDHSSGLFYKKLTFIHNNFELSLNVFSFEVVLKRLLLIHPNALHTSHRSHTFLRGGKAPKMQWVKLMIQMF